MNKHNLLWVIPVGTIFFLAVEIFIFLPIFILGLGLLPFLIWFSPIIHDNKGLLHFKNPTLDELFGNFEDGLCPFWYSQAHPDIDSHWSVYLWFIRNPVANMRRWPFISTLPKRSVKWIGTINEIPEDGKPGWFIAWQGPYVGFLYQTPENKLWLGWKLNPRDAMDNAREDYRYNGLGTCLQWVRF